ncbi:ABC transporter ATP-binding protein [Frondihabitans cladoniiphilus]|uniref:ABC transporter domain-containing protein n=1 Tax=Frondihabitans cladoniiphilus TaxID=715785 RepID=A0ABP8W406_9MICO
MTATDISATPVIRVENLSVFYRVGDEEHAAVTNASFALAPGDRLAIVGESGSGKTTLSSTVAGFQSAPNARVTHDAFEFDGKPLDRTVVHRLPHRTDGLSMVFQDAMTSLEPVWTVGSQLISVLRTESKRSGRKISRKDAVREAHEWLNRVGIVDAPRVMGARPYELSGGMRQRVMLAIALSGRPRLLIADEPTSALDASLSREVMELMVTLTEETGAALIIVTHDLNLCLEYAHRVLVMKDGDVVDDEPAKTIRTGAKDPYTQGLLACIPTLASVSVDRLPTLESIARDASLAPERLAS